MRARVPRSNSKKHDLQSEAKRLTSHLRLHPINPDCQNDRTPPFSGNRSPQTEKSSASSSPRSHRRRSFTLYDYSPRSSATTTPTTPMAPVTPPVDDGYRVVKKGDKHCLPKRAAEKLKKEKEQENEREGHNNPYTHLRRNGY